MTINLNIFGTFMKERICSNVYGRYNNVVAPKKDEKFKDLEANDKAIFIHSK